MITELSTRFSVPVLQLTPKRRLKQKSGKKINVRLLSVLRGHFSSPPQQPNDLRLRKISLPDLIHYIIFLS